MTHIVYILSLLVAVNNVQADLPIHALLTDIAGTWVIERTQPVNGDLVACGSTIPNTVYGNIDLGNYGDYLKREYTIVGKETYVLTLEPIPYDNHYNMPGRDYWRSLAVKDEKGEITGSWTSVFDQGFEIRLKNGKRYSLYMRYTNHGDGTYITDPNNTQMGWAYDPSSYDGSIAERACAHGRKIHQHPNTGTAFVKMMSNDALNKYSRVYSMKKRGEHVSAPLKSKEYVKRKDGPYACDCSNKQQVEFKEELPSYFRWDIPNAPPVSHQQCGICYAIATRYVLQARFLIQLQRLENPTEEQKQALEELSSFNLEIKDITTCDMFNQGCEGGYSYLTGKHMQELGLTTTLNKKKMCSLLSQERRYFAKDYGYVGGCYQCTACQGEELIMHEVYNNGPVMAAMDASVLDEIYDGGIITVEKSENNAGICDVQDNPILTGWEYTSHAVVIEGWGEEQVNGENMKYWWVRNSWGKEWGSGGYFKIQRGINALGIEAEPVFVDPDLERYTQVPTPASRQAVRKHGAIL